MSYSQQPISQSDSRKDDYWQVLTDIIIRRKFKCDPSKPKLSISDNVKSTSGVLRLPVSDYKSKLGVHFKVDLVEAQVKIQGESGKKKDITAAFPIKVTSVEDVVSVFWREL